LGQPSIFEPVSIVVTSWHIKQVRLGMEGTGLERFEVVIISRHIKQALNPARHPLDGEPVLDEPVFGPTLEYWAVWQCGSRLDDGLDDSGESVKHCNCSVLV
jgi:hypothetical protein